MPKNEMNYNNTIIYKIVCNDINVKDLYVGHTTNFKQRKSGHKTECNMNVGRKYEIMNKYGGWNNWCMVVIENYPCKNKLEAEAKERYWIETLKANLNSIIPGNKENITDDTYLLNQSNNFKLIMGDSYEESDKKTCSQIKKQELNDKINLPSPKEIELLREQLSNFKNQNDMLIAFEKENEKLKMQIQGKDEMIQGKDEMIQGKDEMIELLKTQLENQNEIIKQLSLKQHPHQIIDASHNTVNHNKFNLNFYLNETCKNAISFEKFIQDFIINHNTFDNFIVPDRIDGNCHKTKTFGDIFHKNMTKYPQVERPIQTTDKVRNHFYYKTNDKWVHSKDDITTFHKFLNEIEMKIIIFFDVFSVCQPIHHF